MGNYATRKTPRLCWHVYLDAHKLVLARSGRALLCPHHERAIRRGIYRGVAALRADIASWIELHNREPKPFGWTKSADYHPQINRAFVSLQCTNARMTKHRGFLVQDTSRKSRQQPEMVVATCGRASSGGVAYEASLQSA